MRLAVDANIVFAALLAPRGTTASILFFERSNISASACPNGTMEKSTAKKMIESMKNPTQARSMF